MKWKRCKIIIFDALSSNVERTLIFMPNSKVLNLRNIKGHVARLAKNLFPALFLQQNVGPIVASSCRQAIKLGASW